MSGEAKHIVCPNCNSVNRIPGEKDARKAMCGHCHQPLFTGRPSPVTAAQFATQIERNDIPVVVDFWAEWCGPCRMISPALEEISKSLNGKVKIVKLNVDENPGTASKYGIMSIPTLMLFKDGKLASQKVGAAPKGELVRWINETI